MSLGWISALSPTVKHGEHVPKIKIIPDPNVNQKIGDIPLSKENRTRSASTASTASMSDLSSEYSSDSPRKNHLYLLIESPDDLRLFWKYSKYGKGIEQKDIDHFRNVGKFDRKINDVEPDKINGIIDEYKKYYLDNYPNENEQNFREELIDIFKNKYNNSKSRRLYNKKLHGGKRKTAKKQRKTRKSKKSKRATRKH